MAESENNPRAMTPDEALPLVEPPTAGFIIQLFVVPAVIVSIIVMLWLMFSWLAHMGDNPDKYIAALQRNNPSRWQAASSLALALQRPGNEKLKTDVEQANKLAALLSNEIDDAPRYAGDTNRDNYVKLRAFLARVLGEFHLPDQVLPTLLKAATTQQYEDDIVVRRAAIEAIAVLASNNELKTAEIREPLLALSAEDSSSIRSATAYTLGVVGGDWAIDRLARMLDDAHPSVRYNAATGLARHGQPEAIDVLIEMLNPEIVPSADGEESPENRLAQEMQIRHTALNASRVLFEVDPDVKSESLRRALSELLEDAELEEVTRVEAMSLMHELEEKSVAG